MTSSLFGPRITNPEVPGGPRPGSSSRAVPPENSAPSHGPVRLHIEKDKTDKDATSSSTPIECNSQSSSTKPRRRTSSPPTPASSNASLSPFLLPPSLRPYHDNSHNDKNYHQEYCHPLESTAPTTFSSLPPELHLQIASHLAYPDALSLKHTSRGLYHLVHTDFELKIDWLVQRRLLHLECPSNKGCDLGSDLRFCRGSVGLLMRRRREHVECESRPGLGCLVYSTPTCAHRARLSVKCKRWLRRGVTVTVELWWVVLALVVPVLVAWGVPGLLWRVMAGP